MQLTKNQAKAIASFINVASDKKDPVPVLHGVKASVIDGVITIYATNRMVIAKQVFEVESEDVEVIFPPEILKFFKTATGSIAVEISDEGKFIVAKASDGRSVESVAIKPASYPKIEEHVPDIESIEYRQAPLNIDFDLLASVSKLVSTKDDKYTVNAYQLHVQPDNERGKPKPVIAIRENIVAVIQPRVVK